MHSAMSCASPTSRVGSHRPLPAVGWRGQRCLRRDRQAEFRARAFPVGVGDGEADRVEPRREDQVHDRVRARARVDFSVAVQVPAVGDDVAAAGLGARAAEREAPAGTRVWALKGDRRRGGWRRGRRRRWGRAVVGCAATAFGFFSGRFEGEVVDRDFLGCDDPCADREIADLAFPVQGHGDWLPGPVRCLPVPFGDLLSSAAVAGHVHFHVGC